MTAKTTALGPKARPDEISRARLRRTLVQHFGEADSLDAHLALMDSRGVLSATHALEIWSALAPQTFFGLVRHVIRTQCEGPVPDPDVEGWLAAGRPDDDELALTWDLLNLTRYGDEALPARSRPAHVDSAIELFDALLRDWDVCVFADAYCKVELFIRLRGVTLPPIGV